MYNRVSGHPAGQGQVKELAGMGIVLSGIVLAIAIGVGAGYFLVNSPQGKPAWQVYSTTSTRVGDPGHNLVGQSWNGEASPSEDVSASG